MKKAFTLIAVTLFCAVAVYNMLAGLFLASAFGQCIHDFDVFHETENYMSVCSNLNAADTVIRANQDRGGSWALSSEDWSIAKPNSSKCPDLKDNTHYLLVPSDKAASLAAEKASTIIEYLGVAP